MQRFGRLFARVGARASRINKSSAAQRLFSAAASTAPRRFAIGLAGTAVAAGLGLSLSTVSLQAKEAKADWNKIRKDIVDILEVQGYDDGHLGPVFVRLAWHASGTYDKNNKTGGSDGATMRFVPEAAHGANAGLAEARKRLEPIKAKNPEASIADIWIYASIVAIEDMGGPKIPFRPGRSDKPSGEWCTPDGRLPAADSGTKPGNIGHIRDIFYRMGMNDQEIVALCGAHALGRCHTDRSGYTGPWTRAPTTFSNEYFRLLLEADWKKKSWKGPMQYENADGGDLMMLPTDLALIEDREFKKWVEIYAKDEKKFFNDFSKAYQKLTELGCNNLQGGGGWF